ncbi:hypothetical protein CMV_012518 [Castanea mollissima]|uniref:Uncharacterized protein n=1 Tax=Castanea mollissima TaxID=60419 RepID=A0A8J4RFF4_9ROSI|nr:hypothetical protein CMV_012518 [Castanea mollissima]
MGVEVHVMCLTRTSIVVEGCMGTLGYVNQPIIPRSSRRLALWHIVMHMMIPPVYLRAQGLTMWSLSTHPESNQCAPIITTSSSATPMDQKV